MTTGLQAKSFASFGKKTNFIAKSPQNARKNRHFGRFFQADDQIRTGDLILTKDALYRLSYISAFLERDNYHTTQALDLQ